MNKRERVLVVDGNPLSLQSLARLLRTEGYEVLEASTGRAAVGLARSSPPELALVEAGLPDMTSQDLCEQIKAEPDLAAVFVVLLLLPGASREGAGMAKQAGADGHVTRPAESAELLAWIQAMLRIRRVETQLEKALGELEQDADERTVQLLEANAALQEEVGVRKLAEEAEARYGERLRNLHAIDQAILAAHSPEDIAEAALGRMRKLLPYEQATIVELDPLMTQATILAAADQEGTVLGGTRRLAFEQLQLSRTLQSGQARRMSKTSNLFQLPDLNQGNPGKTWESILDLPLNAEGKLVGALNLATDQPGAFSVEHQEIAQEIADQLAVSIRQARLFEEVCQGREHLLTLSLKLVEVQEAERRFIARELHDEVGQVLTSLRLVLDLNRNQSTEATRDSLKEAVGMIDELMDRIRQISLDLRPQMLDDLGLLPALEWHFKRYFKQTNIRVEFKRSTIDHRLPSHLETAVFRIVQEALTNVARHAGVEEVTVRLWMDDSHLRVQVEDKGTGFDVAQALAACVSNGLSGMRERAELLGGEFTLESSRGSGTRLTVELPLRSAAGKEPGS